MQINTTNPSAHRSFVSSTKAVSEVPIFDNLSPFVESRKIHPLVYKGFRPYLTPNFRQNDKHAQKAPPSYGYKLHTRRRG
jgi:hypothetical protein